jgi:outer membrane biosynthesis protein TonB
METEKEKQNKRKGLFATVSIHTVLLIIFAYIGLSYSIPPPEEGMMLNFGYEEHGLGTDESEPAANPDAEPVAQQEVIPATQPPVQTEAEEEVATQESEESIALRKQEEARVKTELAQKKAEEQRKAEEERKKQELKAKSDAMFAAAKKGGTGSGEGNTKPGGNQGSPNGTPGAPHGLGGSGDGFSYDLGGRSMVSAPKIVDTSQKEGKVVVDIIVDKYGKVVKATPGGRGSTTADRHLEKLATEAAYNTKFNAKPDAAIQQKGSMSFVFILE